MGHNTSPGHNTRRVTFEIQVTVYSATTVGGVVYLEVEKERQQRTRVLVTVH
jgi:hypothetical protein